MRYEIDIIKARLLNKDITYDEAKAEAKPLIDYMNSKSKEIAKKHGVRARLFSFAGLMR